MNCSVKSLPPIVISLSLPETILLMAPPAIMAQIRISAAASVNFSLLRLRFICVLEIPPVFCRLIGVTSFSTSPIRKSTSSARMQAGIAPARI